MKTTIQVDIQPFTLPNFVRVEGDDDKAIPISELDSVTLDALCREFRTGIFEKAGAEQPPIAAPTCPKCERTIR